MKMHTYLVGRSSFFSMRCTSKVAQTRWRWKDKYKTSLTFVTHGPLTRSMHEQTNLDKESLGLVVGGGSRRADPDPSQRVFLAGAGGVLEVGGEQVSP